MEHFQPLPVAHLKFHAFRVDDFVGRHFQISGPNLLAERFHQRERSLVLNNCIGNEQREFAPLDQLSQQEGVFAADCPSIKHARLNVHVRPSNCESGSIQISQATIRLQQMLLKSYEPQFLNSADQGRAIARETELKTVVLRETDDRRGQNPQTVQLEPRVSVSEQ
jgi:hypothetical protein